MSKRIELTCDITDRLVHCSEDELRVVKYILARFDSARATYGPLDVSTDGRDFQAERAAEFGDAIFYEACDTIARAARRTE